MIKPLKDVLSYENKWVINRFEKCSFWFNGTNEEVHQIFMDLKRFLWLYATIEAKRNDEPGSEIPDIGFTDSMLVIDEMWHSFILYTDFYTQFCNEYLGGFMHHPTPIPKYVKNEHLIGGEKALEIFVYEMINCTNEYFEESVLSRWFDEYSKFVVPK